MLKRVALASFGCLVFGLQSLAAPMPAHHVAAPPAHPVAPHATGDADSPFVNNHYVLTGSLPVNGYHKEAPTVVVVDKGSHFTYVLQLQGKRICRVLTISNAIGTADKPTPPGRYVISYKKHFPTWIPPKTIDPKQKPVPPYNQTHKNPLGVAAIYLNKFDIDLHGTNEPGAIRKSASHGCVRHSNSDITRLYNMVEPGDAVYIVNKFRGKVLQRADFAGANRKRTTASTETSPKAEKPETPEPTKPESKPSKSVSIVYYTVDT